MPPNVLLVVLDSLRARNLGLYGYSRETTPFLSEFSSEAVVYEQARSGGVRSITGHASLFTGATVEEHGLTSAEKRLKPGTTIFEQLQDEGYDTAVFSENVWITNVDMGLREGFDTVVGPQNIPFPDALDARGFVAEEGAGKYRAFLRACADDPNPVRSFCNGVVIKLTSDYPWLYPFENSPPGDVYLDKFLDWHADRDGPWGACINLMDGHSPYEPDPEHNRWGTEELLSIQEQKPDNWELISRPEELWKLAATESLYDGTIRQLDSYVERLVTTLRDRGELDDTLLVVTSDHGEGFGEPSEVRPGNRVTGHNTSLHEALLHVPLLVRFPGQTDSERVETLASLTEFPSVVRDALDGESGPESFCPEQSLVSSYALLADEQLKSRVERFQDIDSLEGFDERLRAVYENDDGDVVKHLAWGDRRAVTVRIRDAQTAYVDGDIPPADVHDRFADIEPEVLTESAGGIETVDTGTQQRLEDLGYM